MEQVVTAADPVLDGETEAVLTVSRGGGGEEDTY